jgi:hypothetical protein
MFAVQLIAHGWMGCIVPAVAPATLSFTSQRAFQLRARLGSSGRVRLAMAFFSKSTNGGRVPERVKHIVRGTWIPVSVSAGLRRQDIDVGDLPDYPILRWPVGATISGLLFAAGRAWHLGN